MNNNMRRVAALAAGAALTLTLAPSASASVVTNSPVDRLDCIGGYLIVSSDYTSAKCAHSAGSVNPDKRGGVSLHTLSTTTLTCSKGLHVRPYRTPEGPAAHCKPGPLASNVRQWNAYEAGRLKFGKKDREPAKALFKALFKNKKTPHCVYEDASGLKKGHACKWDAGRDGINGYGYSFVAAKGKGATRFIYANGSVEK